MTLWLVVEIAEEEEDGWVAEAGNGVGGCARTANTAAATPTNVASRTAACVREIFTGSSSESV